MKQMVKLCKNYKGVDVSNDKMPDEIEAEAIGPFCYFRKNKEDKFWRQDGPWNITHIPSGMNVIYCMRVRDCVDCIRELMDMSRAEFWNETDPIKDRGFRLLAAAIVKKYKT